MSFLCLICDKRDNSRTRFIGPCIIISVQFIARPIPSKARTAGFSGGAGVGCMADQSREEVGSVEEVQRSP